MLQPRDVKLDPDVILDTLDRLSAAQDYSQLLGAVSEYARSAGASSGLLFAIESDSGNQPLGPK